MPHYHALDRLLRLLGGNPIGAGHQVREYEHRGGVARIVLLHEVLLGIGQRAGEARGFLIELEEHGLFGVVHEHTIRSDSQASAIATALPQLAGKCPRSPPLQHGNRTAFEARTAQFVDHFDGTDGIAAQALEFIVDTHATHSERALEGFANSRLHRVIGGAVFGIRAEIRHGQLPPVHLAVRVLGNGIHGYHEARRHVRRRLFHHPAGNLVGQLGIVFEGSTLVQHHIGYQALGVAICHGQHGHLLDEADRGNERFHLGELDTVAADLHLRILAPHEADRPVGQIPRGVARTVHARIFHLVEGEGIAHEGFSGRLGTPQVAFRKLVSGKVQIAHCA